MRNDKEAIAFFEECGFRVVQVTVDDFYMLVPNDKEEEAKYGVPCLSPHAMEAISERLKVYAPSPKA